MNASRLREVVDMLIELENDFQIQAKLNTLYQHLAAIVQQPPQQAQQPQLQNQFASSLKALRESSASLRRKLKPAQEVLFNEIGAGQYFVDDIAGNIDSMLQKNPITPSVVMTELGNIKNARQNYISTLNTLGTTLEAIGIKASILQQGEAEIGFLLPRPLFDNEFEPLIKELQEVKFFLRAFSECATGSVEPIKVKQISTSHALFFLGMSALTIKQIGNAVTWALDTWKQVEEIRKMRTETKKLRGFTEEEVEDFFGSKIKKSIDSAISEKLESLLSNIPDNGGRLEEQREHLKRSLEWLLTRIERGVTFEIRFLPPPKAAQKEGQSPDIPEEFKSLQEIAHQLVFPRIEGPPILPLPEKEDNGK